MIPKVIHYCWFGGKELPRDVQKCIASWKKYCPDYEIRQWNETNFDVTAHPFVKAAYEAKAWAFVSDYVRLQVVYDHGGVYLDTDVELQKSLDAVRQHRCYVALQQVGHWVATGLGFGAEKGSEAVLAMLKAYDAVTFDNSRRELLACPILNTRALAPFGVVYSEQVQHLPQVTVYPPKFFDPVSPGDAENLLCEDTVSIHHYSATWQSSKQRLKRRLMHMIGQERVMKLRGLFKK